MSQPTEVVAAVVKVPWIGGLVPQSVIDALHTEEDVLCSISSNESSFFVIISIVKSSVGTSTLSL